MSTTAISQQGETLDLILYRTRGSTAGLVEQTLELNPGLADLGTILAGGLTIQLPPQITASALVRTTVQLWN